MSWTLPNGPGSGTTVLTPGSTVASGSWTADSGDFDASARTQDWGFVRATGTAARGNLDLDFGTYELQQDERCAGVKLYVADHNEDTVDVDYYYGTSDDGLWVQATDAENNTYYSDYAWHASGWKTTCPAGTEWVQAKIDAIRFRADHNSGAQSWSVKMIDAVAFKLDIRKKPAVTVTGPSEGALNQSLTPTITWQATLYNSQSQSRFRVRVFSAAQYTVGGFDPTVSTATYDSGWVSGTNTSHTIPADQLSGGTVYRAYVQVSKDFNGVDWDSAADYNSFTTLESPVVAVTSPTEGGTVNTTTRPVVEWTYTVSGGKTQTKYQIKIFDDATYGGGGFDPDTSTPDYDSGVLSGNDTSHTPTTDLANDTYRAYVRAAYTLGSDNVYSDWDYNEFTLNSDTPVPPSTPVATLDAANARIQVVVQGHDNLLTQNQASLETDTTGWTGNNCAIARSTSKFKNGSASLRLTASSAADMLAYTSDTAVEPDTDYTAIANFCADATTRNVLVAIDWYDVSNVFISTSQGSSVAETGTSFPGVQASVSATSPANAAYARVIVYIDNPANGEIHYVDEIGLMVGSAYTTWGRGGLKTYTRVVVEYSDDGGTTWAIHPDMEEVTPDDQNTQLYTMYDYRSIIDVARQYRAYVTATPSTSPVTSTTSAASSGVILELTDWWLKDMTDPDLNLIVYPHGKALRFKSEEQQATYSPLGRSRAFVVSDVIQGDTFTLELQFASKAAYLEFKAIRDTKRVLLLQSPWLSQQWWVKIGKSVNIEVSNSDPPYYIVDVPLIEVDAP